MTVTSQHHLRLTGLNEANALEYEQNSNDALNLRKQDEMEDAAVHLNNR